MQGIVGAIEHSEGAAVLRSCVKPDEPFIYRSCHSRLSCARSFAFSHNTAVPTLHSAYRLALCQALSCFCTPHLYLCLSLCLPSSPI